MREPKFIFEIKLCPAPRMTRSDQWKTDPNHPDPKKRQRPCVTRYFAFRDRLRVLCKQHEYELSDVLDIVFIVQMPDSWSKKKKEQMEGMPHQQRPDRDNYLKAFQDTFSGDDGFVWDGRTTKVWGRQDKILIF